MNLEQFATESGVSIIECSPEWGGKFGYVSSDTPTCSFCGFKSKRAAYTDWLKCTFGEKAAKAVLKLLKESERTK